MIKYYGREMIITKCNKCGFENSNKAIFCEQCGTKIKNKAKADSLTAMSILVAVIISLLVVIFVTLFIFIIFRSKRPDSVYSKASSTSSISNTNSSLTTGAAESVLNKSSSQTTTVNTTVVTTENPYAQKVYPSSREYNDNYYVNTAQSNLIMRCGPGKQYNAVFNKGIPKGTKVTAYAYETDSTGQRWAFIYYNGYEGWCMNIYLKDASSVDNIVPNDNTKWNVRVIVDSLRFRSGPSQTSEILRDVIPKNTILKVIDSNAKEGDEWINVQYDGLNGWIMTYDFENSYVEWIRS